MVQYTLLIDYKLCFGCHACEVACKQENNLQHGMDWIKVVTVTRKVGERVAVDFVPMTCMHCRNPPCVGSCPVKAITKSSDGIVIVDQEICIGCGACIVACPFKAPQFNPQECVVEICTMCLHRVKKGLRPSCVHHCPAQAILFGDAQEVSKQMRETSAKMLLSGQ